MFYIEGQAQEFFFGKMLLHAQPNTENAFLMYFLEPKTNIWKIFSNENILHSKKVLHLTKHNIIFIHF